MSRLETHEVLSGFVFESVELVELVDLGRDSQREHSVCVCVQWLVVGSQWDTQRNTVTTPVKRRGQLVI